ncbi:MAG: hypothetical protein O3C40_25290 [Planctomycetota bacterium]|nr:hypothetical protein [Planctomycetota bacterium]
MSTAAHEPRRVGPRRTNSSSVSKVTPRRNAPEASEANAIQYDSNEVPVLIRLPNLRDISSEETNPAPPTEKKRRRIDRASAAEHKTSKRHASTAGKKSLQRKASDNKLVLGGVFGGVLVVVLLFVFNAGGPESPTDAGGWAGNDTEQELLVGDPDISIPAEIATPEWDAGFEFKAPQLETTRLAGDELDETPLGIPYNAEPPAPWQAEPLALPSKQRPVGGWPSEDALGPPSPAKSPQSDLWPGESLSAEHDGYQYPTTDSPTPIDYRSSMYPTEEQAYRTGRLDPNRSQSTQGEPGGSILDGTIAIPDTKSLR